MSVYQGNDFKRISGGRRRPHRSNRKYEAGSYPTHTTLSSEEHRIMHERVRGGNIKLRVKKCLYVNVTDPKTGKSKKCKILKILETPANREYSQRGIITKGAVVETELGKVRITSRPGQEGVINAILLG
ncbi:MAG: 30S ribosomal protein S8e [Sulfolobales archaeon]